MQSGSNYKNYSRYHLKDGTNRQVAWDGQANIDYQKKHPLLYIYAMKITNRTKK
jgi:hypothetical protein